MQVACHTMYASKSLRYQVLSTMELYITEKEKKKSSFDIKEILN